LRLRTDAELQELFAGAGLRLTRTIGTRSTLRLFDRTLEWGETGLTGEWRQPLSAQPCETKSESRRGGITKMG
jgi:hypothetical protein